MKKRNISLALVFALLVAVFAVPASAEEIPEVEEPAIAQVVATMDAESAQSELKDYLSDNGVDVHPGDEIVALSTDDGLLSLQTVQKSNEEYIVSSFATYDNEGTEMSAPISVTPPMTRSYYPEITWQPNSAWGSGAITVKAMVKYDVEIIAGNGLNSRIFLNPNWCSVYYYYNNGPVSVTNLSARVELSGKKCNSNYVDLGVDYFGYTCTINTIASPQPNVTYTASGGVPSGTKVEYISNASYGIYLTVHITVNGTQDGTTRPMHSPASWG